MSQLIEPTGRIFLGDNREGSLGADEGLHVLDQLFDSPAVPVFTEGQQEDFDPLKNLPPQEGPSQLDERWVCHFIR